METAINQNLTPEAFDKNSHITSCYVEWKINIPEYFTSYITLGCGNYKTLCHCLHDRIIINKIMSVRGLALKN